MTSNSSSEKPDTNYAWKTKSKLKVVFAMLNMCSFPKSIVKYRHLLWNPSPFKKISIHRHAVFWSWSLVNNDSIMMNLVPVSHRRKTLVRFAFLWKLIPFLNKALLSKYFLARFPYFFPSFVVARKHIILWLGCHYNPSEETTRKKWKELATYLNVFLKSYKIFHFQTWI